MDCDFTTADLDKCSYRYLQQTAKAMSLPSNVKKMYLVKMIYAKQYHTTEEVERIVSMVKQERHQLSVEKKKQTVRTRKASHIQGDEITSTSNFAISPPITVTPKRPRRIVPKNSPEYQPPITMKNRKSIILKNHTTPVSQKSNVTFKNVTSDRVLRSCNVKASKKSNLDIFSASNAVIGLIKVQNPEAKENETRIKIISKEESRRCILKSCNTTETNNVSKFESSSLLKKCIPYTAKTNKMVASTQLAKRQRLLSGIYPLQKLDRALGVNLDSSIGVRHSDGKYSKINAIVQKSKNIYSIEQLKRPTSSYDFCIQDVHTVQTQTYTQTTNVDHNYPNMSAIPESDTPMDREFSYTYDTSLANHKEIFINIDEYYHKKIRADQVRFQRRLSMQIEKSVASEERLPNIGNVFSKFSRIHYSDVTQPIYTYVGNVSEKYPRTVPSQPAAAVPGWPQDVPVLETVLNFRSQFLPLYRPLLPVNNMATTTCVHSTPVIVCACEQLSSLVCTEQYASSFEQDSQELSNAAPPDTDIDTGYYVDYNETNSPGAESQDDNVTIPDMVEDAFEIISQDGDYMERLGMDIKMQCVLCSWAGPRIVMEYHIRKEHSEHIHKEESDWCVEYSLSELRGLGVGVGVGDDVGREGPVWSSRVYEHDAALYLVSVQYREPACFMATLTTFTYEPEVKYASLTVLDQITGTPHTWKGEIQEVPPNLPYDNDLSCLTVELSELNLLPASGEPDKVTAEPPEVNDIRIILNVNIY